MSEIVGLLQDSLARLLADKWGPDGDASALWRDLTGLGVMQAPLEEAHGGAGLTLPDVLALVRTFAAASLPAPVPLPEALLGAHLLSRAGLDLPAGRLTLGPVLPAERLTASREGDGWRLSGTLARLPWSREADHAVVALSLPAEGGEALAVVAVAQAEIAQGLNLAAEPRDTLSFAQAPVVALAPFPHASATLLAGGAALRSAQIAATCTTVLDLCLDHAATRVQFGRPIGKFQAVQQNLAVMAGHAAAAGAAADLVAAAAGSDRLVTAAALAKTRAGEAAGAIVALAHQTFAALGYAEEHVLHRLTKRLLSWREEMGSERHWAALTGREAFAAGGAAFWQLVSGT